MILLEIALKIVRSLFVSPTNFSITYYLKKLLNFSK